MHGSGPSAGAGRLRRLGSEGGGLGSPFPPPPTDTHTHTQTQKHTHTDTHLHTYTPTHLHTHTHHTGRAPTGPSAAFEERACARACVRVRARVRACACAWVRACVPAETTHDPEQSGETRKDSEGFGKTQKDSESFGKTRKDSERLGTGRGWRTTRTPMRSERARAVMPVSITTSRAPSAARCFSCGAGVTRAGGGRPRRGRRVWRGRGDGEEGGAGEGEDGEGERGRANRDVAMKGGTCRPDRFGCTIRVAAACSGRGAGALLGAAGAAASLGADGGGGDVARVSGSAAAGVGGCGGVSGLRMGVPPLSGCDGCRSFPARFGAFPRAGVRRLTRRSDPLQSAPFSFCTASEAISKESKRMKA